MLPATQAAKWARSHVDVAVASVGGEVVITVADDAPGMPKAERDTAVAHGIRLDERMPGSGLGLGIAADLAALHRGRLEIGEGPAGGLAARLRLPRVPS